MAYIQALAKAIANQLSLIWTTSNRLPVDTGATANSVTIQDPTTGANKIAVNGSGQISVSNQPTGFATETTLTGTKTSLEAKLGDITDAPATDFNSSSGLSGLVRLALKLIRDPSATTASSTGTVNQQLRFIAENSSGGTQYDNGATPATPRGTVALGRNGSNVLSPLVLDSSGYLRVAIASGAPNSPTEYSEGSSITTTVGGVALGKKPDGTLLPIPLNSSGLLQITAPSAIPVTVSGGSTSGTQYTEGSTAATVTGTAALGKNASNLLKPLSIDASGYLQVSIGAGANTQYADAASVATPTGTVALANKSGVVKALQLDTNNYLQVSAPDLVNKLGTVGDTANVTGTILQQLRYIGESLNRATTTTAINESVSGDRTIITGTVGKKIAITTLLFTVSGGASVILKDGSTAISGSLQVTDFAEDLPQPIILSTAANFVINVSATANVRGFVVWYLI